MKKLMSVLILVAFIGSMVVMTGCFGGDSKALFAALAIGLIITASTGGAGAAAFAANERTSLRPAISITTDNIYVKITPMDAATGALAGDGTKYVTGLATDSTASLTLTIPSFDVTSYNQFAMEVYADDKLILKSIGYLGDSEKTGTDHKVTIDPTTTAKALVYEKWNTGASSRTYAQFDYNLDKLTATEINDLNTVIANVQAMVTGYAQNQNTTMDLSTVAGVSDVAVETTAAYNVSGYVYAADGSGQTDCIVYVYSDEAMTQMVEELTTTTGRYSTNLPDGTYYFKPTKANHTYTPTSTKVEVNGANVSGINFQAASTAAAAYSSMR
ncbi:MAG: hypothetical protein CVV42_19765 [Candidatus Riflebacteria bacterium HGW-Riflebacteria-2]|jgi:hypothetical protein|nr:MAG: hypothetical protein CVV42_19765 [Candidatus Riflebacteria bacterium HGW-Riflebacteria-2]